MPHAIWAQKQKPPETGEINGLSFTRIYWTGMHTVANRGMRGFVYVAKDGSKFIRISSQDMDEPAGEESIQLAEAATMTFAGE